MEQHEHPHRQLAGTTPVPTPGDVVPDPAILTPRQRKVYEFIVTNVDERGYPPSVREIADQVGLSSTSSVHYQLRALEDKGFIRRDPRRPRALEIVGHNRPAPITTHSIPVSDGDDADSITVPLVGRIAAGAPILAEQSVEDTMAVPTQLLGQVRISCWRFTVTP